MPYLPKVRSKLNYFVVTLNNDFKKTCSNKYQLFQTIKKFCDENTLIEGKIETFSVTDQNNPITTRKFTEWDMS